MSDAANPLTPWADRDSTFIIRAVDSHDLLVKALSEAADRLEARGHQFGAREARASLALVGAVTTTASSSSESQDDEIDRLRLCLQEIRDLTNNPPDNGLAVVKVYYAATMGLRSHKGMETP